MSPKNDAESPAAPRAIVIHNSVTGFAETYGGWVAEAIGADLVPWERARTMPLGGYDLIVYGAGVRMSRIRGFSAFRRRLEKEGLAQSGKVLVWANGGTPQHPDRDWRVPSATFTRAELAQGRYPFVYVEGGVRYEGLNLVEERLLRLFSKRVQRYRHRGEWAVAVADSIAEGYDHSSPEQIEPLIAMARQRLGLD
ncbi:MULTISPECIES: flavodoxin domain-containing protein [unclassified Actinomyces]|uniref:flavodoxin domain-containing protein n=1 Tax=unclassified Actinomyces TaxID=2609248 RepID=UPI002017AF4F|nr:MULTISPECIES: flavodoxin domain-containing protein [unclassified Actinomyces]MCL3776802.1 hypothetical protein [Actinomyces sp. AC-20-1]MCL3790662.1 hypothetical protein [Actinomyces sp. 187325]MCL3792653.1 hypothetical protein [Actinomyces sp. 186855]MCL3795151.1 hypothetical protein [Actinomyces sp. 217892]